MKSEPTISTQKFALEGAEAKYTPVLSKKSSIELYPVKNFLDQAEIGRYLPTYRDGITITQIQYLAKCYIIAEGYFLYYHFSLVISYLSV